jgi:hypothetical protein
LPLAPEIDSANGINGAVNGELFGKLRSVPMAPMCRRKKTRLVTGAGVQ